MTKSDFVERVERERQASGEGFGAAILTLMVLALAAAIIAVAPSAAPRPERLDPAEWRLYQRGMRAQAGALRGWIARSVRRTRVHRFHDGRHGEPPQGELQHDRVRPAQFVLLGRDVGR